MSSLKKVLITGANGFTGREMVRVLLADSSKEIYLTDRTETEVSSLRVKKCDLSDLPSVEACIEKIQPNEIYHLVGSYTNVYDVDYISNVTTTKNILDALRSLGLKTRVLLVGSSAEYGFPLNPSKGVGEDHPLLPVSVYGLVKTYQHMLMGTYVRLYGLDLVAVRPFNLLGNGVSPVLFAGKMRQEIQRYKKGEIKSIVTGDLSVERDYIDIREAITYYRLVMEQGATGEVYNVGSGKSIPLRTLMQNMLVSEGLSFNSVEEGVHHIPGKIVVPKICADITKIKRLNV